MKPRHLLVGLLLGLTMPYVPTASCKETETNEAIRRELVSTYEKQTRTHRAWEILRSASHDDSASDEPRIAGLEFFRHGEDYGLAAFTESGDEWFRVTTQGEVLLLRNVRTGMGSRLPGAAWKNKAQRAWCGVADTMRALWGYEIDADARWQTAFNLDLAADPPVVKLEVVEDGEGAAAWLEPRYFTGEVKKTTKFVTMASKESEMVIRRDDGAIESLSRIGPGDVREVRLRSVKPRWSAADWTRAIASDREAALEAPGGWDFAVQCGEFCRVLGLVLKADRDLVKRGNRLRGVLDLLLSVLYGGDWIDEEISRAARAPEPRRAGKELAQRTWTLLERSLRAELQSNGKLTTAEKEALAHHIQQWVQNRVAGRSQPREAKRTEPGK